MSSSPEQIIEEYLANIRSEMAEDEKIERECKARMDHRRIELDLLERMFGRITAESTHNSEAASQPHHAATESVKGIVAQKQLGPTEAILLFLSKWQEEVGIADASVSPGEIAKELADSVKTSSPNKRHVIQTTLVNLRKAGKVVVDNVGNYRLPVLISGTNPASPNSVPPAEEVANAMGGKSMRVGQIALLTDCEEGELLGVLTPGNGFSRNQRGWYSFTNGEASVDDFSDL